MTDTLEFLDNHIKSDLKSYFISQSNKLQLSTQMLKSKDCTSHHVK